MAPVCDSLNPEPYSLNPLLATPVNFHRSFGPFRPPGTAEAAVQPSARGCAYIRRRSALFMSRDALHSRRPPAPIAIACCAVEWSLGQQPRCIICWIVGRGYGGASEVFFALFIPDPDVMGPSHEHMVALKHSRCQHVPSSRQPLTTAACVQRLLPLAPALQVQTSTIQGHRGTHSQVGANSAVGPSTLPYVQVDIKSNHILMCIHASMPHAPLLL